MKDIEETQRFTQDWRDAHGKIGDVAMIIATQAANEYRNSDAQTWAAIAQAHYAAANVRARPADDPRVKALVETWLGPKVENDGTVDSGTTKD
jgi:hypothetical protein